MHLFQFVSLTTKGQLSRFTVFSKRPQNVSFSPISKCKLAKAKILNGMVLNSIDDEKAVDFCLLKEIVYIFKKLGVFCKQIFVFINIKVEQFELKCNKRNKLAPLTKHLLLLFFGCGQKDEMSPCLLLAYQSRAMTVTIFTVDYI